MQAQPKKCIQRVQDFEVPPRPKKTPSVPGFVGSSVFVVVARLRAQDRGGTFSLKDKALNSSKICVFTQKKKAHMNFFCDAREQVCKQNALRRCFGVHQTRW